MDGPGRPTGNPFAPQHGRSSSFSKTGKPEDALELLTRELVGPQQPASSQQGGAPAVPPRPTPNYNPMRSSPAATGQVSSSQNGHQATGPGSGAGSGPASLSGDGKKAAGPSPRNSMSHQGLETNGAGGGLLPAYIPPNYNPMKSSRVASGPVPTANLLAQDIPGLQTHGWDFGIASAQAPLSSSEQPASALAPTGRSSLVMPRASLAATPSTRERTSSRDAASVEVDGVSQRTVDAWFAEADWNKDGRIAGEEAKNFFKRTGLSAADLSKIWNRVKAVAVSEQEGLSRTHFAMALRLVALAQSGASVNDLELTRQAVSPRRWAASRRDPLPPPRIAPATSRPPSQDNSAAIAIARGAHVRHRPVNLADLHGESGQNAFASLDAQRRDPFPAAQPSNQAGAGGSPPGMRPGARMLEAPVCFDARLPPLHPKLCAHLTMLAGGHGSLFAGPSCGKGVLQWARPEGNMRRPTCEADTSDDSPPTDALQHPLGEDKDIAPSSETLIPEGKQVTCLHVDEVGGLLWVGHVDGKVSAFQLGPKAGAPINTRRIHHWQAHKMGAVTAICRTPWGEVWTGTSRGYIRVWRLELLDSPAARPGGPIAPARELRRQGGLRASSGPISFLVVPPNGQVVWSGGDKTLLVWCAYTGVFLGALKHYLDPDLERDSKSLVIRSEKEEQHISRPAIDPRLGLELDSTGRVNVKTFASARDKRVAEQEAWASQTDKKMSEFLDNLTVHGGKAFDNAGKAAGKAGKFLGRVGMKIARNIKGGEADGGSVKGLRETQSFTAGRSRSRRSLEALEGDPQCEKDESGENGGDRGGEKAGPGPMKALVADAAGCMWVGSQQGRLDCFTFSGRRLGKAREMGVGLCSLAAVGTRLWVGLADGRMRVYSGSVLLKEWRAHEAGIIAMALTGSRMYSLAADGSIKGWCSSLPSDYDQIARQNLESIVHELVKPEVLEVLCLTWNVNEQKPDGGSALFGTLSALAATARVAVFALQEIEMGGSSVAMAAAKDALLKSAQEKGNNNGQWWSQTLLHALGGPNEWMRVGLRQLSGMLVLVYSRIELQGKIGEVSTASVACGVLGLGGNKGAVAVSFTLYRRRIACVCSHFAAHQQAVEARNMNYATIVKNLRFSKMPWYDLQVSLDEAEENFKGKVHRLQDDVSDSASDSDLPSELAEPELIQGQGMRAAEMLIWMGDFNYRINLHYEDCKDAIRRKQLQFLLEKDQLRAEKKAGRVFRGLEEGKIDFQPTYKFDKHTSDPIGYDTSEKRRVPAWTDRIFFRGSMGSSVQEEEAAVLEAYDAEEGIHQRERKTPDEIMVRPKGYHACIDVTDSDHKPVWAQLSVDLPVTLQEKKRRKCSHLLKDCFLHTQPEPPQVQISPATIQLHPIEERSAKLMVSNTSSSAVVVRVSPLADPWARSPPDAPRAIPDWLDIFPICARIEPKTSLIVSVCMALGESSWAPKDRRAQLRLQVDHEYAAGGQRPEGGELRDQVFTVESSMKRD